MKLNITIYTKNNYYSIYNGNTLLHSGETNGKSAREIVKSYGYEITYMSIEPSDNYNVNHYYMEVK